MFNRLMGWTVLSITHGVVREYVENQQFHQYCKPNGQSGVIGEDKGGPDWPQWLQRAVSYGTSGCILSAKV